MPHPIMLQVVQGNRTSHLTHTIGPAMSVGQLFVGIWFLAIGGLGLLSCLEDGTVPRLGYTYTREDDPVVFWSTVGFFGFGIIAGLCLVGAFVAHLIGLR